MILFWTGLAPWNFEFPFPGSLTSTFRPRRRVQLTDSLDFEPGWGRYLAGFVPGEI